ncbi:hypothetical protein C1878_14225 [Gordonibacter sp. 28C]|uniref:hypothetical protein n=1 Tax=Gordonibacter sp. 28C TaxID=2078569 RepID=UPI000DF7C130|nr:hypothetical protein [Gordonibacter sp. 28C]RDB60415.1 hypothetical protein C1878_14225 [Gordonibacter sp. 28C]
MRGSFGHFLLGYCQELTGCDGTSSLKRLFQAMRSNNPRAAEPLLLLALCQGREGYLLKTASNTKVESSYRAFLSDYRESGKALETYLDTLPEGNRFKKAYVAWQAERTRLQRDRLTLENVSRDISEMLDEKRISRADACRALSLNKGNFYAFLKGDTSKLSRKTAVDAYKKLANI